MKRLLLIFAISFITLITMDDQSIYAATEMDTPQTIINGTKDEPLKEVKPRNMGRLTIFSDYQYANPSPDPKVVLGIWWGSGYQPNIGGDYYTVPGHPVSLYASLGRSLPNLTLTWGLVPHYRWYVTDDFGETWDSVPKDKNGNKMHFSTSLDKEGTYHYQMKTFFVALGIQSDLTELTDPTGLYHFYTKYAAVHVLKDPIKIEDMDIDVEDYYLYYTDGKNGIEDFEQDGDKDGIPDSGMNVTYAKANLKPFNAVGDVTWSISDSSLATIDDDGKIVANSNGKSGEVTVTATFTNIDGTKLSRTSKPITVGGGLEDQTTYEGTRATFEPINRISDNGTEDAGDLEVEYEFTWYRINKEVFDPADLYKGAYSVPNGDQEKSYTTWATDIGVDDGARYYLESTMKYREDSKDKWSTKTFRTNPAKLTVLKMPDILKNIVATNTVKNLDYSEGNDEHNLYKVTTKDNVVYEANVSNDSDLKVVKGHYVLPLPKEASVNFVIVNDRVLPSDEYQIVKSEAGDKLDISGINFDGPASYKIMVDTGTNNVLKENKFEYQPYFYDESDSDIKVDGSKETINYVTNNLEIKAEDITFDDILTADSKVVKHRKKDDFNLSVHDGRRTRNDLNLYVAQESPWINTSQDDTENQTLKMFFRYIDSDKTPRLISKDAISVTTLSGKKDSNLEWGENQGPLLYVSDKTSAGNYKTYLTWTASDSV